MSKSKAQQNLSKKRPLHSVICLIDIQFQSHIVSIARSRRINIMVQFKCNKHIISYQSFWDKSTLSAINRSDLRPNPDRSSSHIYLRRMQYVLDKRQVRRSSKSLIGKFRLVELRFQCIDFRLPLFIFFFLLFFYGM